MQVYRNQSLEDLHGETWKDIIGWEGYYKISNLGRVKSIERYFLAKGTLVKVKPRILVQLKNRDDESGYLRALLCRNGTRQHILVHRLVAECFAMNPFGYTVVNHMDCNKLNNHFSNLEWVTHTENRIHAIQNNRINFAKGERHGCAKLKEKEVVEIKRLLSLGVNQTVIARKFKASQSLINRIKMGHTWKHLDNH